MKTIYTILVILSYFSSITLKLFDYIRTKSVTGANNNLLPARFLHQGGISGHHSWY